MRAGPVGRYPAWSAADKQASALDTYDQRWHREALPIRVGGAPPYRSPWQRRAHLIGFMTALLDG